MDGGAIYSMGILQVLNSTFEDNSANGYGGAIFNGNEAKIFNSTFKTLDFSRVFSFFRPTAFVPILHTLFQRRAQFLQCALLDSGDIAPADAQHLGALMLRLLLPAKQAVTQFQHAPFA